MADEHTPLFPDSESGTQSADERPAYPDHVSGRAQPETAVTLRTDPALRELLCLTMVSGVGPNLFQSLVEQLGSPAEVLRAPMSEASFGPLCLSSSNSVKLPILTA